MRNAARNAARKEARRATEGSPALEEIPAKSSPSTRSVALAASFDADGLALDDVLAGALDELAPEARASLVLSVVHELSYAEIGALLDVPPGTVGSHVSRARRVLRERLAPLETRHDR